MLMHLMLKNKRVFWFFIYDLEDLNSWHFQMCSVQIFYSSTILIKYRKKWYTNKCNSLLKKKFKLKSYQNIFF